MNEKRNRVLFLCTEPAGYFLNCIRTFQQEEDSMVKVVHWPSISIAPFIIDLPGVDVLNKSKISSKELMQICIDFSPDILYVAGWVDKSYLQIAKRLRSSGTIVIGGLDNPWKGTWKQRLSSFLSGILVKPYFDFLWVPGSKQQKFARHLGYSTDKILTGLYVADIRNFSNAEKKSFDRYLVYVGRFEQEKGVDFLIDVFSSLTDSERNGWRLRMIGNGSLRFKYDALAHISFEDFMQPGILAENTRDAGGFILTSLKEPWGVVVQEFAAAGLPLILSDAVSAGEMFLKSGHNGYEFHSGNKESLKDTLLRFFQLDDKALKMMGQNSYELAMKLTPQHWAKQVISVKSSDQSGKEI